MVDQAVRHIDRPRLRAFRDHFSGEVVLPDDETYDASRAVWNGMIDRRPALILRPTSTDEVVAALRFARDEDLAIAVRSGGHSLPGHSTCDDGVIIDLAGMRGVTVDPERRVARCNGGARLAELDDAAQAVGLACTAGTVSHTGIAGLTLGGGMGRLQRKLGLAIDCLRAVELVTADGRQVRASADDNADLFWGMRGAGPNFGIVTALEFDLAPIGPTISRGFLVYSADRARDVFAAFREFGPTAPDDVFTSMIVGQAEEADELPAAMLGEPVVVVSIAFVGSEQDADRILAPLLSLGAPLSGGVRRVPYLESQHANDESMGWGHRIYTKSGFVNALPDELVDALVDHVTESPPGEDVFSIWAFGRRHRPGARGRDRLRRAVGALLDRRGVHVGRPGRRRGAQGVGPGGNRPDRAVARHRQLRERRNRVRRRGARPRRVRQREVRPAGRAQAGLGPGQRLPAEPEHPALIAA